MSILSDREKIILRYIVEDFIHTANPVGSRYLSKRVEVNLSPASIRNVMSDLEDLKFLTHTHTSAGRIPTDKGYRYFVNELMESKPLDEEAKSTIIKSVDEASGNDDVFMEVSKILGKLTQEISVVSQPYFSEGVFEKIELLNISSNKILVVVSIGAGIVRTLIFDIESEIKREKLENISRILNEKLSGLSLKEIRSTHKERIGELRSEDTGIVKVFVDSIDKIFQDEQEGMTLYIAGTADILSQPEFVSTGEYKNIIELTENKDIVYHVMNKMSDESGTAILIGEENEDEMLKNYSIVTSTYSIGDTNGKIAVIGPRRMDYSKMVSMLDWTSKVLTEKI